MRAVFFRLFKHYSMTVGLVIHKLDFLLSPQWHEAGMRRIRMEIKGINSRDGRNWTTQRGQASVSGNIWLKQSLTALEMFSNVLLSKHKNYLSSVQTVHMLRVCDCYVRIWLIRWMWSKSLKLHSTPKPGQSGASDWFVSFGSHNKRKLYFCYPVNCLGAIRSGSAQSDNNMFQTCSVSVTCR